MTRRQHVPQRTIVLLGALVMGCVESSGPIDPRPNVNVMVSDASQPTGTDLLSREGSSMRLATWGGAQATGDGGGVAYVSLPPGTYPGGVTARIESPRLTGTITVAMTDGGLDPVAVPAMAGDSLAIEILTESQATLARTGSTVPATRRPRVVRTVPPRGKTDIAVNAVIVVVFSEPVAGSSLSPSAVQLLRGNTSVAGTSQLLQGAVATVVFQPTTILEPNASYRLVVRPEVRDLEGEPLEEEVSVDFATGSSLAPEPRFLSVRPDMALLRVGSRFQFAAEAFGLIESTMVRVPLAGVPIEWTSQDPTVAPVSPTGMVTGTASGLVEIRATIPGRPGAVGVSMVQVSNTAAPVASLDVVPASDTTPVTGKIQVTAITRSAAGDVLLHRPLVWSTLSASIATVEPTAGGRAWVTGISSGRAFIVAASEERSDTVVIEVVDPGPYVKLSAGRTVTCGVRSAVAWGFCWGDNADGKVGDGTFSTTPLPRAVSRGLRLKQISTGSVNTCAVDMDGNAYCWGANAWGSLGIGGMVGPDFCPGGACSVTPVAVTGDHRFTEIDVSDFAWGFVCGLTTDGAVFCWGDNHEGQLGVGPTMPGGHCTVVIDTCSSVPVAVAGERSYVSVTTGGLHACALAPAGDAYCWGDNGFGQIGDGGAGPGFVPVRVAGGYTFVALAAGGRHTCGITSDGAVYCWGSNFAGALGHAAVDGSTIPVRVRGDLGWAAISAGELHTCALTTAGAAYCWGLNDHGALGNGSTENASAPVVVEGGLIFASITAGSRHSCGVTTDGIAYCWGDNASDALGADGSIRGSLVPVRVRGQP